MWMEIPEHKRAPPAIPKPIAHREIAKPIAKRDVSAATSGRQMGAVPKRQARKLYSSPRAKKRVSKSSPSKKWKTTELKSKEQELKSTVSKSSGFMRPLLKFVPDHLLEVLMVWLCWAYNEIEYLVAYTSIWIYFEVEKTGVFEITSWVKARTGIELSAAKEWAANEIQGLRTLWARKVQPMVPETAMKAWKKAGEIGEEFTFMLALTAARVFMFLEDFHADLMARAKVPSEASIAYLLKAVKSRSGDFAKEGMPAGGGPQITARGLKESAMGCLQTLTVIANAFLPSMLQLEYGDNPWRQVMDKSLHKIKELKDQPASRRTPNHMGKPKTQVGGGYRY